MKPIDFYQAHLNRVSRSFAFCIARLNGDLRLWVSLSYLLCRLLDTVEDALWDSPQDQQKAFAQFKQLIEQGGDAKAIHAWAQSFPKNCPPGEIALLNDAVDIFSDFHTLPDSVRSKIERSVLNMFRGMHHFANHPGKEKVRLKSLAEVNQYCFFVAGLVGELLTDLILEKIPLPVDKEKLYLKGHHFGLFLQKINLLKDQHDDEKEGRFLIHSRAEVLASLKKNAHEALEYIQSLPVMETGYRLFCAWSLFLGLASLPWIERSWALGFLKKIPRLMTQKLLKTVEECIDDNAALLKLFLKKLPKLPTLGCIHQHTSSLDWFRQAYAGRMTPEHMAALELLPLEK